MDPPVDFKSLQENIQGLLVSTVKTVNRISAEDLDFQRTVHPTVSGQLDENSSRILGIAHSLLKSAAKACNMKAPRLDDPEDIDLNWRGIVDVVDTVLEKADTAIDEYTGVLKRKEAPTAEAVRIPSFYPCENRI
jgi:exosome complex exonuclease RRP6